MKKLLFLCGPNGIGKTTISKQLLFLLPRSAYVDSDPLRLMNPFVLDDQTIPTIAKNIGDLISNYLLCPAVETVIFSYGFHGRRKEVFERVMERLRRLDDPFTFLPFLLWCEEEENIRRMQADGRDSGRIERTLRESRTAYAAVPYPRLDITRLSAHEAASLLLSKCTE